MDRARSPAPEVDQATLPTDLRTARLVELVRVLSGCTEAAATHAVERSTRRPPSTADDALEVVARALISLSHGFDLRDAIDLP